MNITEILFEALAQSGRIMGIVILIVVPLLTIFEILVRKKILDRISKKSSRLMKWFDLPGNATFPMISGLIMGIAYGAGVLYEHQKKKILKTRDFNILCTFLSLSHAIIEDTIIFTLMGASFVWIFGFRILLTLIVIKIMLIIGRKIPGLDFFGKSKSTKGI